MSRSLLDVSFLSCLFLSSFLGHSWHLLVCVLTVCVTRLLFLFRSRPPHSAIAPASSLLPPLSRSPSLALFNTRISVTQAMSTTASECQWSSRLSSSAFLITNILGLREDRPSRQKSKRVRTIFSQDQLNQLELEFQNSQYIGKFPSSLSHSIHHLHLPHPPVQIEQDVCRHL